MASPEDPSRSGSQTSGQLDVPPADAAIILSVTAVLVALIILFLFQTPGLQGLGILGE